MEAVDDQLETLARRYAHRVPFFVDKVRRSFMLGPGYCDDLVSAGYWGLFKALRNRRMDAHERELSAYVSKRIHGAVMDAARGALNQLRWRDPRSPVAEEAEGSPGTGLEAWACQQIRDGAAGPEDLACEAWRRTVVGQALDQLEPHEQRVVRAYMEGASLMEIARQEGIAPGTMQARFRKLMQRLRAGAPELRRILLDREAG